MSKHRITIIVEPDSRDVRPALDLHETVRTLVANEGYDPEECVTFEYERVSWEPVWPTN